jgi:AraC-like DNA-binding protein
MNQVFWQQENCTELKPFLHIYEFALKRNSSIRLNSFEASCSDGIRIYYIVDGKFEWIVDGNHCTLFPSDLVVILPGKKLEAQKGYLEIGSLYWICIQRDIHDYFGNWSSIPSSEKAAIKNILSITANPVLSKLPDAGILFADIQQELKGQELGYATRVNHLLDELFILVARRLSRQNISQRSFPDAFLKLEEALRKNLSHHWTVEEMAALVGLGTTAFSDKVKNFTGFSPLNYLINIRISEAIKLLKRPDVNMTDIALDTGFYSSQHFSTTFKKLTGYTPSEFRKNNTSKT